MIVFVLELAIGAPESNLVVLIRSFASITVELSTKFPHLQVRKTFIYIV